jgi:hypothetical protein
MNRISIYWLAQATLLFAIAIYGRLHQIDSITLFGLFFTLVLISVSALLGTLGFWLGTRNIDVTLKTKALVYLAAFPAIMSNVAGNLASGYSHIVATLVAVAVLFTFSFLVGWKHDVYVPKWLRG